MTRTRIVLHGRKVLPPHGERHGFTVAAPARDPDRGGKRTAILAAIILTAIIPLMAIFDYAPPQTTAEAHTNAQAVDGRPWPKPVPRHVLDEEDRKRRLEVERDRFQEAARLSLLIVYDSFCQRIEPSTMEAQLNRYTARGGRALNDEDMTSAMQSVMRQRMRESPEKFCGRWYHRVNHMIWELLP